MLHKSQIFFWLLISFLSGIFVASIFGVGQIVIDTGLMAAIGLIGVFGYSKSFNGKLILAGFLGVAFLFGVIRINSANFDQGRLDVFTDLEAGGKGIEVIVNGYVDDETVVKGNRSEIVLRAKELVVGDRTVRVDDRIMITANSFPKFDYGDAISVIGTLQKPTNLTDFDYITYLKKENIRTTMFYPEIVSSDEHFDTLMYPVRGKTSLKEGSSANHAFQAGRTSNGMGFFEKAKIGLYKKIFLVKRSYESAVARSVSEPNAAFINGILLGSRQKYTGRSQRSIQRNRHNSYSGYIGL